MRTIKLIPGIPKEEDTSKFPDSTIKNETDTEDGTPVVREIYGDVLTNLYKLLRVTGITASNIEDNELNGYQILEALKKLPNVLNDVEQVLNLSGSQFSLSLDFSLLPNKYFIFVRAAEANISSTTYTIKGSGPEEYPFTIVNDFSSGDELLLILDQAGVRAYNLSNSGTAVVADVFTPFGTPLAFNDGSKVWYQSEGVLFSDVPETYDLQSAIRLLESDGTILVYEMLLISGSVLCLCFYPNTITYNIYKFSITDLATPVLMTLSGGSFPTDSDQKPNIYTDGANIFITNSTGNNSNSFDVDIYTVDINAGTLTYSGGIALDDSFEKTTNAAVKGTNIFTFIGGVLKRYNLGSGALTFIGSYPGYIGVLFSLNGQLYYTNGEVAKKWTLPV